MRPSTGGLGGKHGGGEGFERWEFWWEHNKDPFLQLKDRLAKGVVLSQSTGGLTSHNKVGDNLSANRPSPSEVKDTIVPAFIEALNESHPDIVDSAALAIGRTLKTADAGNIDDAATPLGALKKALSHQEKTARESSTLSMGVLGSVDAIETLRNLLNDTNEGRKLTNHPAGVEDMIRSFAAAALGMIGDPKVIGDFEKIIGDQNLASKPGVKAMSILALGMMNQNHEQIVPFLIGVMEDHSLNNIVRAQAPIALGRLNRQGQEAGSPAARAVLSTKILRLFTDDKTDNDLRRSLAVCIGMLATTDNADAISALMDTVAKCVDDQTRHFSIMALAEIGGRDPEPAKNADTHKKLEDFFVRELTAPKHVMHQSYGALGLAVYSRNEKLAPEVKTRAQQKLLDQFNGTSDPSKLGAMAIALGLVDHKLAAEDLWKKFQESKDQQLKGYIAVALGLMYERDRADELREEIQKKGLEPKYRLQLARALGLMSDAKAVDTLVTYVQNAETTAESASAAQALGLIGDKTAVKGLLEILKNKSKTPLARGFSAVALGLLAEKTTLPWNAVFSVDSNYRAKVDALSEILDIL